MLFNDRHGAKRMGFAHELMNNKGRQKGLQRMHAVYPNCNRPDEQL